ncbi:HAD superfamily hydrolase (TIGR01509 family) [Palleronia aestuarii]|uniref:HAD superfamily hydrolase (TIGR01509 family) n=1 Tax=Palleronia aestuarii TaxID=568105 RepID=A0A2W7MWP5_9RHOB|nr:HAD family hydrolase [Palleronia aestuarii]PZX12200.1 HAD superfamily hydrolase (TIGR01509 family) [Palleronia aestuarii]
MIVFDCDGVLVDSEILSCGTDAELMRSAGHEITLEDLVAGYIGWPKRAIWDDIAARRGTPWPDGLFELATSRLMERIEDELVAVAGVAKALDRIPDPKAVASSSGVAKLHASLARCGLTHYFDERIFSAQQVARGKPAPDIFLFAAEQSGVAPRDCLVIEDSAAGVTAARATGMPAIGFTGASHTYPGHADALLDAGAVTVIADMRELPAQIDRFRRAGSAASD